MENPFNPGYWTEEDLPKFGFAAVGTNVRVAKNCTILGLENISLGSNVRIDGPTVIAASAGYVRIGSYVHIGGMSFIAGAGGVEIADFAGLSQGVRLYSASDDYSGSSLTNPTIPREFLNVKKAPIMIGRHVIVGSGSVVLPGCTIGEGSSVGALTLVTKSLESWGVFLGTPAKRIKRRSKRLLELEGALLASLS
ncbi:galactoside O-acetyltransferase [Burkholderia multivorans]|uniref:acyltransferase n=1 Tax=Burkholderia multivorans TaxID=87883 RepID=UPI0008422FC4|nr:acyltransferase [Burkholderia multivorans]AOJ93082.1 galactoside O-acetyltransferase [Burkholderia multivorans]AOJ93305.1 galactoside O-acetyltransferase [Burkholderia multivorans]